MNSQPQQTSGGIGLLGALLILFVALKLTDVIDWSWWWVLAPAWAPSALLFVVFLVIGVFAVCSTWFTAARRKLRNRKR